MSSSYFTDKEWRLYAEILRLDENDTRAREEAEASLSTPEMQAKINAQLDVLRERWRMKGMVEIGDSFEFMYYALESEEELDDDDLSAPEQLLRKLNQQWTSNAFTADQVKRGLVDNAVTRKKIEALLDHLTAVNMSGWALRAFEQIIKYCNEQEKVILAKAPPGMQYTASRARTSHTPTKFENLVRDITLRKVESIFSAEQVKSVIHHAQSLRQRLAALRRHFLVIDAPEWVPLAIRHLETHWRHEERWIKLRKIGWSEAESLEKAGNRKKKSPHVI